MKTNILSNAPLKLAIALGALVAAFAVGCNTTSSSGGKTPEITVQPRDTTLVEGSDLVMTISAKNAQSYKWVKGTSDTLADQISPSLTLTNVPVSEHGSTYKCVVFGSSGTAVESQSFTLSVLDSAAFERQQLIAEGQPLFQQCTACHGHDGVGEAAPPLKHSDYLIAQRMRPVRILLLGLPNEIDTATTITVNGIDIVGQSMFPLATSNGWTDRQIAAVLTYVRAVLNDSTSVNCTVSENQDGQLVSDCDIVPSPEGATTTITPEEVGALRDSLRTAGILEE